MNARGKKLVENIVDISLLTIHVLSLFIPLSIFFDISRKSFRSGGFRLFRCHSGQAPKCDLVPDTLPGKTRTIPTIPSTPCEGGPGAVVVETRRADDQHLLPPLAKGGQGRWWSRPGAADESHLPTTRSSSCPLQCRPSLWSRRGRFHRGELRPVSPGVLTEQEGRILDACALLRCTT